MSASDPPSGIRKRLVELPAQAPAAERIQALEREAEKLSLLLEMTTLFSTVKELDTLISLVADHTTRIMACERSSVFLLDHARQELFSLVAQGLDVKELRFSSKSGIAGFVAREGVMLNIPDAYQDSRFNQEIDKTTGFRTVSILCAPMRDRRGNVLGVVQCLNKCATGSSWAARANANSAPPTGSPTAARATQPFAREDELLLSAVASQAAFYLENTALHRKMDQLFESFVEAISQSIDDRDPCTSGHSRRVMQYALRLARAVHESNAAPFGDLNYTRDRLRQLRYAALLHDVGKIGVRECVLSKASKLSPLNIETMRQRLTVLREKSRADWLAECIERSPADLRSEVGALFSQKYKPLCEQIDVALKAVEGANVAGFLPDPAEESLRKLLKDGWIDEFEYKNLAVRRGNLTDDEWVDMRSHVTKSYRLLQQIPWPDELKDLAEIAYGHHEKRDGSGYPRKLKDAAIHFDSQILTVADIYDALTASDRPYKKAIPFEKAKAILLQEEAAKGKIMPELVDLFFAANCYRATAV
jgi:HD-GYP domain-containing protein (c-di-GMP phosphodiesterase class II)